MIPQLGVHVGGGGLLDLVVSGSVGQVDAHRATDLRVRVINEGCQALGQVEIVAGSVLLHGLTESVDVRAVEIERVLLRRVLIGDVLSPPRVVDVHHELVIFRLVHALGGWYPPLLVELTFPVGSVILTQAPLFFDGARVVVVVGCVSHRVGE